MFTIFMYALKNRHKNQFSDHPTIMFMESFCKEAVYRVSGGGKMYRIRLDVHYTIFLFNYPLDIK